MLKIILILIIIAGTGAYFGISWNDVKDNVDNTLETVDDLKNQALDFKSKTEEQLEKGTEKLDEILNQED